MTIQQEFDSFLRDAITEGEIDRQDYERMKAIFFAGALVGATHESASPLETLVELTEWSKGLSPP